MRSRSDPLLPVLASCVALVVLGAAGAIFYPRIARLLDPPRPAILGHPPDPSASVPIWVGRGADGVALILEVMDNAETAPELDRALKAGRHHYLVLRIYNFAGPPKFIFELPASGLSSPEGGAPALPVATLLRKDVPRGLRPILAGLGAVRGLEVVKGRMGQLLLAVVGDPSRRTAFVSGKLRLDRKELAAGDLASWRAMPDWKRFKDF